ncbi:MAG: PAS domain S-box protein [Ferruginibacter sp.]
MKKNTEDKQTLFSSIIESSEDAIISKNLDGTIISWNKGAEKIFGYSSDEMIGKPITMLIPASLLSQEEEIINNIKAGKVVPSFRTTRLNKEGKEIQVSVTISPVKDKSGYIVGASKIARDITVQLEKEKALTQNSLRLQLLNSVAKAVSEKLDEQSILQIVTDATTTITGAAFGAFFYNTMNEYGESYMLFTLSGAPREAFEKFGMPRNTAVFHPTFSGQAVVRVDDITKDPRYGKAAPHFGMPKGHLPVVSYLAVPVVSTSGMVIGGLFFGHPEPGVFTSDHEGIVSSISALAAVALDNSRLFAQVKSMNEKKDEFIALASHELKTPLTTIKGYLQIIQQGEINETSQSFLEKTLRQVENLNNLVSDLFDVSKVESGKLQLVYERFDLRSLLTDIIEIFHQNKKTHTFLLEDAGEPLLVEADRQRIEQVIMNLFTNAVKYSPKAGKVYVKLEHTGREAKVMVKDEGMGLSIEQQKKIFTKFYRAENPGHISGLGLGLYLTREIINRHKGKIYVKSEPGKGAEFNFTIPVIKETK